MLNKNKNKSQPEVSVAEAVSVDNKKQTKKTILRVLYALCLIITLLSVFRIPYIGQFFDSVFFEFIFGWAKYFLYGYVIFFFAIKTFDVKKKPLYSKRYFFFSLIITALLSMLLGGIQLLSHPNQFTIKAYVEEIWTKQYWDFSNFWYFGQANYIDGGIIGAILSSISGVFIVILALIALIATFFAFFPKQRKEVLKKLLIKTNKDDNMSETKQFVLNQIKGDKDLEKNESIISTNKQSNFSLKDSYVKNDINARSIRIALEKYLDDNKLNFSDIHVEEDDTTLTLKFNIDAAQAKEFEKIKGNISSILNDINYKLSWIDTSVLIKIDKYAKQVSSTLITYMSTNATKEYDCSLCLTENHQPIIINLLINNIIGISSDNNPEFVYSYINALISYLSINYKKDKLQIACLSPIEIKEKVLICQNTIKSKVDDYTNFKKYFNYLIEDIKIADQLLKKHHVQSISELNKLGVEQYIKFKVIVIDNMDLILKKDKEMFNKIVELIKHARRFNLAFVIIDNSPSGETFTKIPYSMILSFDTKDMTKEQLKNTSNTVIKMYVPDKKQKYKIRLPRLGTNELTIISNKLASLFNEFKE